MDGTIGADHALSGVWQGLAFVLYMTVFKRKKSIWWMPWCVEAMKDVARCDKPREVVSKHYYPGISEWGNPPLRRYRCLNT